jgi:tetratricopeptide (TPR) repeat protein
MTESPNKLNKIWQELKRRKTGKVIVAYAATAFILLQLADILTPALSLPSWTTTFVTFLLVLGFPIAVIFSWIFDLTPQGIKKTESVEVVRKKKSQVSPVKRKIKISDIIIACLIVIVAILAYPKIFNNDKLQNVKDADGRISIAVTNFDNNTNDSTLNWLKKGIPELIRNNLTSSKEISVQSSQTMYELYESMEQTQNASVVPSLSREAATKLKTGTYITGSFQKFGNNILTYVKLIDTKNDELLWTGSLEGEIEKYKYLADSISAKLKYFLEIKVLKQKISQEYNDVNTNSPEALRKYGGGMESIIKGDYSIAAKVLEEAYRIDSTFTLAAFFCADAYLYFDYNRAASWQKKAYAGKDRLPNDYKMWIEMWNAYFTTRNPNDVIIYANSIKKSDTKSRYILYDVGCGFNEFRQFDQAVEMFEKIEKISMEWGGKWNYQDYYFYFALACHNANMFDKEGQVLDTGLKLFPNAIELIWSKTRNEVSKGNPEIATELISKYRYLSKQAGSSESDIENKIGNAYEEANSLDKAEEYYRKALSLEPENPSRLNSLAFLLIDKDRNVNEGLEYIDKALKLSPDVATYLDTKGWGLLKQGKSKEALENLNKSWDLTIGSNGTIYFHLESARKTLAGQKND